MTKINQMSFNPITNLPLIENRSQQNQMKNAQKINDDFNNQNLQMDQLNNKDRFQQMKDKQREETPIEYNPYKQPYSIYQGHP